MTRCRTLAAVLTVLLALTAGPAMHAGEPADTVTTLVLVRHAEKGPDGADPALSEVGRERAEALARLFADAGVTALVATPYRRTHQTLEPLARRSKLEIEVRPVDLADPTQYARSEVEWLLARHQGETVVVAGHSNTVPLLLGALGIADPPDIRDDEYDDLFVVFVGPGAARRSLHLHYGRPSP